MMVPDRSGRSATPSSRATRSRVRRSSASTTFRQLFTDPKVARRALSFTVKYAIVLTIVQVLLGYLLALLYVFWLRQGLRASSARSRSSRSSCPRSPSRCCSSSCSRSRPCQGLVNDLAERLRHRVVDWFASPHDRVRVHHHHGPLALDGLLRRAALRRPRRHPRGDARVRAARRRVRVPARPAHRAARCRCPSCCRRSSSASTAR